MPWQRGGLHGGCPALSLTPLHGTTRLLWGPDPALDTPPNSPSAPVCTSIHQDAPALPDRTKAVTPPRQQIPRGHLGKPPFPPAPPISFLCKKQAGPAAGTVPAATRCRRIRAQVPVGAKPTLLLAERRHHAVSPGRGGVSSPRKVLEMYSETWFPERLVSERCVSSRFSILLNCGQRAGLSAARGRQDPCLPVLGGSVVPGSPCPPG